MAATEIAPGIVIDKAARDGKPRIKGTRVPVEVVVGHLAAGDDMATICTEYGVTEQDVRRALGYAAPLLGDEVVRALR